MHFGEQERISLRFRIHPTCSMGMLGMDIKLVCKSNICDVSGIEFVYSSECVMYLNLKAGKIAYISASTHSCCRNIIDDKKYPFWITPPQKLHPFVMFRIRNQPS